jgi:arginine deiminase
VIGHGAVMIGLGERTTPQGVETLARALFSTRKAHTVIAVELPRERAFMHLDTAMTMVDRDAFSVYPYMPEELRSFTLRATGDDGEFTLEENADLFAVVADALGLDKVRVLRTPIDKMGAQREQWDDGNNFLAVAPGVVLGYERNTTTNRYLADEGIEVVPVVGSELGRGRGGPRCMTCPIEREPAD